MKKVMILLAVGLMCLTACAQKKGGERGPRMGGGMSVNKDSDSPWSGYYMWWKWTHPQRNPVVKEIK